MARATRTWRDQDTNALLPSVRVACSCDKIVTNGRDCGIGGAEQVIS